MNNNEQVFKDAPVKQAVLKMAIPTVVSSLVLVIYNMADTFFVGQTHDAFQVAAVSLTNPVFVMYMALANLLGIGGSTLISILLGQDKKEEAKQVSSLCGYGSILFGVIIGLLIIIFMNPLLNILGSSVNTIEPARDYLIYIAIGAPFILFANTFGHALRGEGAAKAAMLGGMIGTITNIVLDPIFILTFDMKTAGAAIATVIGNVLGCLYYIYYFKYKSPMLSLKIKDSIKGIRLSTKLMQIGLPAGVNSALMSIATIMLNNQLVKYGDSPVAAMGIVNKAYMLIVFIHMGIANGIQPLLGYCYGAHLKDRFKSILKFSAIISVSIGIILTVIYIFMSQQIMSLFINDKEVIKYGKDMLIAVSLAGPILGILFLAINSMQAMEKAIPATLLSICRQGFIFIPALYILDMIFGLTGINYTQTFSDYVSIIISLFLLKNSFKSFDK
jgi:putative MATE family efflux protein